MGSLFQASRRLGSRQPVEDHMHQRLSAFIPVVVLLASVSLVAQAPSKASRTVDGHPDLQGVWNFSTITPLERTAEFSSREFLADAEATQFEQRTADRT